MLFVKGSCPFAPIGIFESKPEDPLVALRNPTVLLSTLLSREYKIWVGIVKL